MNREETIKALMIIQAAYPNYKPQDKSVAVNVWTEMLSDVPYEKVNAALKAYIQTDKSGFAPSIGEIRSKIHEIFSKDTTTDSEAWQIVWKAICCSGDYDRAVDNFNRFPTAVKRSVGSPGQLREWALTENLNVEVVSSNFKKTYRSEIQREQERRKLSPDILKLIQTTIDTPKQITDKSSESDDEGDYVPAPEGFLENVRRKLYEQQTKEKSSSTQGSC